MAMGGAIGPFLAGWTAMMAAMMLPSALPMIRLYGLVAADARRTRLRTAIFVSGYLLLWAAFGVPVWLLGRMLEGLGHQLAPVMAVTLLLAGAYQFSPLKTRCLRVCRTPMDFLTTHWYRGAAGALRLGVEHGWYCIGCCWALMAVFVIVGAMSIPWAIAIAVLVLAEKVLPRGPLLGRATGLALVAAGIILLARPDLAMPAGMDME